MDEHQASRDGGRPPTRFRAELDSGQWCDLWRQALWQARLLGAEDTDAEDIAQETMARFITAVPDIEQPNAWVRTVARRLFIDRLRRC
ncbi:MAG: sigma factor [Thermoanaerobaculia bacterium]